MREQYLHLLFLLHLYSNMASASKFNLDKDEKIFSKQSCVIFLTFSLLCLIFLRIIDLRVHYTTIIGILYIYLLALCFLYCYQSKTWLVASQNLMLSLSNWASFLCPIASLFFHLLICVIATCTCLSTLTNHDFYDSYTYFTILIPSTYNCNKPHRANYYSIRWYVMCFY